MAQGNKASKYRFKTLHVSAIMSISLVLFMLGLVGLLVLNAKQLSDYVKENIGFSVELKDNVKEVETLRLQKILDASSFVKSTKFIDKETAAKDLQEDLGEDFVSFLGHNPLLAVIDVKLYAAYANPDSIAMIEKTLSKYEEIQGVYYQESLVEYINENVKHISLILFLFSGLLFVISVSLINSTIRLSIHSDRMLIKTKQLVGATHSFIRGPFTNRSFLYGFIGAIIANVFLSIVIYVLQQELQEVVTFENIDVVVILFILIILIGMVITWLSTFFAVNKFLRTEARHLY